MTDISRSPPKLSHPARLSRVMQGCVSALCLGGLFAGAGFAYGVKSALEENQAFELVRSARDGLKELSKLVGGSETRVGEFLQPASRTGEGVTLNEAADDGSLILLAGFFDGGNEIRLIRRDGTAIKRWPVSFSALFPDKSHLAEPPSHDLNIDLHGALIERDGSIVFNFEYGGTAKLSRCGDVLWTLPEETHHSIAPASGGGYWIPAREHRDVQDNAYPPFSEIYQHGTYAEDFVVRVSEDGKVVERFSVPRLLYDNGFQALLTSRLDERRGGMWDRELVHLNDVEELFPSSASAFPRFKAGDLLLSLRKYNLVLVIDRQTHQVLWHSVGPWLRQHDPDFNENGSISIFNNNLFFEDTTGGKGSSIVRINPTNEDFGMLWGAEQGEAFATAIRGKHQPLAGGGLLVTEFAGGRVFETDSAGKIVWEYLNRYDTDRMAEITDAQLVRQLALDVSNWSCTEG